MYALILSGLKQLSVQEVPTPKPGGNMVLIRVEAAGICGSDIIYWSRGYSATGPEKVNLIGRSLGHEFCGVVENPGDSRLWRKGDRVVAIEYSCCNNCEYCLTGRENLCAEVLTKSPGITADGGFSQFVLVREDMLRVLPNRLTFGEGALVEPTAIAIHGWNLAAPPKNARILVTGAGPVGLLSAAVARAKGAAYVAVTSTNPLRGEFAKSCSFIDRVYDAGEGGMTETIMREHPEGFDSVLECTGRKAAVDTAFANIKRGGAISYIGTVEKEMVISKDDMFLKEITTKGCYLCTKADFDEAVALMTEGRLQLKSLITSAITMNEAQGYFETLSGPNKADIKVIIEPNR